MVGWLAGWMIDMGSIAVSMSILGILIDLGSCMAKGIFLLLSTYTALKRVHRLLKKDLRGHEVQARTFNRRKGSQTYRTRILDEIGKVNRELDMECQI